MQQKIFNTIQKVLEELGIHNTNFVVERPNDFTHGDYSTNAAMAGFTSFQDKEKESLKSEGIHLEKRRQIEPSVMSFGFSWNSPTQLAENLKNKLENNKIYGVDKIEKAGPGFINFFLSQEAIVKQVVYAATDKSWGKNELYKDKTVMVEYTDPNPFKEFHIGHLMSNAIGESVARLLECSGAQVVRASYQGDVGPHVAKAIWGKMTAPSPDNWTWGASYTRGAIAYEKDPEAKKKIDEINIKIYEKSNREINILYDEGRTSSLERFEEIYKTLGTKFDFYFWESESWPLGLQLVNKHVADGIFEKSEGATVFKGEKVGLHTRVFVNSQGLPTYEAKDLGLLELKKEKEQFDTSITVTASEQSEYFKVVLAAAKEIPELQDVAGKTTHISHGMMRFAEGKMSSRRGNVITGESLLTELTEAAKEKMAARELKDKHKIAEMVAVGAIKYAVLKQGSGRDIIFDPEKSLSLEGDSGPYLQYARVRALSLLRAAKEKAELQEAEIAKTFETDWSFEFDEIKEKKSETISVKEFLEKKYLQDALLSITQEKGEKENTKRTHLAQALIHFPEVIERATCALEPHHVTTYLTEIASLFNSWYANEKVIGGENETYGVLLVQAFERTMTRGLLVLGIPLPQEM